jgi:O-methyltransferase
MKKKAVVFGAGSIGQLLCTNLKEEYEILYATDNDSGRYGKTICKDIAVKDKCELHKHDYDYVIIGSVPGLNEIYEQLIFEFNIQREQIIKTYLEIMVTSRIAFFESFSAIVYDKGISGNVAEVGVFRGEFAKEISKMFPDRTLYLFDTFEGFNQQDILIDCTFNHSISESGILSITSEELVMAKLINKTKAVIKRGYFPETFDLYNESFCFVSLDVDLYKPTISGLELFYPRMSDGGIILIHDYFSVHFKGVKAAVDEYVRISGASVIPIGDSLSVAIVRP